MEIVAYILAGEDCMMDISLKKRRIERLRKTIHTFLVVIILLGLWYKVPIKIDKTFDEGYILSYENESRDQIEKIYMKGKLTRNIFSDNIFKGEITIGEFYMELESSFPGNLKTTLSGLMSKLSNKSLLVDGLKLKDGYVKTSGVVHISRDLNKIWGFSNEMRSFYEDNSMLFIAPANNRDEAKDVLINMTGKKF